VSQPPIEPYPPDLPDEPVAAELSDGLRDAVVEDADWANFRALRTSLRRVELQRVRLTGAELAESSIDDTLFADCRLDLAGLRNAKLERVVFRDCRLDECDFYGATLKDVLFERCTLRLATVSGISVTRVELRGCDLAGLRGVESLRGVRMPFHDSVENGPLFAAGLGIELVEED
jgi:uncharacterized protein YjbI with pentapeptide repeats